MNKIIDETPEVRSSILPQQKVGSGRLRNLQQQWWLPEQLQNWCSVGIPLRKLQLEGLSFVQKQG